MDNQYLIDKGFKFVKCDDGFFYVIEKNPSEEANRLAAICGITINDAVDDVVCEKVVLQCDEDFSHPVFYCDGNDWDLTPESFEDMCSKLPL